MTKELEFRLPSTHIVLNSGTIFEAYNEQLSVVSNKIDPQRQEGQEGYVEYVSAVSTVEVIRKIYPGTLIKWP